MHADNLSFVSAERGWNACRRSRGACLSVCVGEAAASATPRSAVDPADFEVVLAACRRERRASVLMTGAVATVLPAGMPLRQYPHGVLQKFLA